MVSVESRIRGSFAAAAIGDGIGMPVEGLTAKQIYEKTDRRGITGFVPPIQTHIPETAKLPPGHTTDDTALFAKTAMSLIACGRYDHMDCSRTYLDGWRTSVFGWGKTTRDALEEMDLWYTSGGLHGRDPMKAAPIRGKPGEYGTGVAMRVGPLAHFHTIRYADRRPSDPSLIQHVMQNGLMTHGDPCAFLMAYAFASVVAGCVRGTFVGWTGSNGDRNLFSQAWARLCGEISQYEKQLGVLTTTPTRDLPSVRLMSIHDPNVLFDPCPDTLRFIVGTRYCAKEAVPFAIATALRHIDDFENGVFEAVNAGGDTDTIALMVGAIIGANVGLEGIPSWMLDFRPEYRQMAELGKQLYDVAVKG